MSGRLQTLHTALLLLADLYFTTAITTFTCARPYAYLLASACRQMGSNITTAITAEEVVVNYNTISISLLASACQQMGSNFTAAITAEVVVVKYNTIRISLLASACRQMGSGG